MSQPFRPHVSLVFFGLEWRLSRELMALDIMTWFHYRSFFLWIFSQLTTKLWIALKCMCLVWNEFGPMNKDFKMWRISKVIKATTFDLFHKHGYAEVENQFLCKDCLNFANITIMGAS